MLLSAQLIQYAAEAPHVRFVVVALLIANLGRKIIRSAHRSLRLLESGLQNLGHTKITELHLQTDLAVGGVQLVQEYVLALQISVQRLLVVHVLQSKQNLHEIKHYLILRHRNTRLLLVLNQLMDIATVSILHHNVQITLVHKRINVLYYIRMVELLQNLCLAQSLSTLCLLHIGNRNNFHHEILV